jgi:asparagine synthase (glutamine-hydrolysing)
MNSYLAPLMPKRLRDRHPGPVFVRAARAMSQQNVEGFERAFHAHWVEEGPLVIDDGDGPPLPLTHPGEWARLSDPMSRLMFLDLVSFLPDDIMVKVDRATMAASLEARAPLLDHRLIELCFRLPAAMKVRQGSSKYLLRQVLYRYVPREIVDRPKKGFGAPVGSWMRGALREWADSLLDHRRLEDEGFFHPGPIVRRWKEHRSGERDWSSSLWDVLTFQAWLDSASSDR